MKRVVIGAGAVLAIGGVATYLLVRKPPYGSEAADKLDARKIMEDSILSPATARNVEIKILAKRDNYRLAWVRVDAQNAFGAIVRQQLCVVWHSDGPGGLIHWRPNAIVNDCPEVMTEQQLQAIEVDNGWPGGKAAQ